MAKHYFYIKKENKVVKTSTGDVSTTVYGFADASGRYLSNLTEGSKVKFVAGNKIPLDTIATVLFAKRSKFENKFNILNSGEVESSVWLQLPDGNKVWTSGKNLYNIEPEGRLSDFYPMDADKPTKEMFSELNNKYKNSDSFFHINGKELVLERPGLVNKRFTISKSKDVGDYKVVLTENKELKVFNNKIEPGNVVDVPNNLSYDQLNLETLHLYTAKV